MILEHLVEVRKGIQPVADAARVLEVILDRTSPTRLPFIPKLKGAACAFLLLCFGVTPGFVPPTLLHGKIDNTSGCVGMAIPVLAAVIAIVDGEFWFEQINCKYLVVALLGSAPVLRAQRTGRHRAA
jgi:hypothetical protein